MKKQLVFALLIAGATVSAGSDKPSSPAIQETSAERQVRMAWWKEARFGMFIHWGLYAVPAGKYRGVTQKEHNGEWIMHHMNIPVGEYEKFASHFDPTDYNPKEWVRIAKNAGMKYIVITTKHHDGFCLWDSKLTDWDVVDATPYKTDLLKPLAEACREAGIKICFYHSIMDWHHPDAQAAWEPFYNPPKNSARTNPGFPDYIETYLKPQLLELLTNYGDIGVMWFDGEWIQDYTPEMGKEIDRYIRSIQPALIVNNRVDKGRKGYQGMNAEGEFAGDFGTPEQRIPDTGFPGVDWESCMTMNDTWGFRSDDQNWKSATDLIRNLVDVVSKGGNFLLNVGPSSQGVIPRQSVTRLETMGRWLDVNGEAIYGAGASPVEKPAWGRYTTKDRTVYAHVFEWPENGTIQVKGLGTIKNAQLLTAAGKKPVEYIKTHNEYQLNLKGTAPNQFASVVAIELK